ncbi:FAD-dependent monooxygenase [Streptomyces acidiscabies]|uniref:FAD-dependent monooxygenase n=1 Tax=Streptomyces acidiscabies TaxID=42234 RepID=A0AAP6BH00_9ACTN|nr:FAD-dependent monooxygenase [Streptomyces acidiscabies]MBZ3913838.1 FAD-dependent monooxygenase [Streptomyces acidiscabies]MDX2964465.1 FAD-dependent monooxygenase [Streptomyces acidiscabies]MDX3022071.1 FAD-dependent monooxygenase [Streptomyces acidiscabies]MDX3793635.1 FAD-dependent monooxygenase [Streptomyces acidiscabies]
MSDTDVIVVGAGPTGLTLAAELRLGGARVTVVERLAEPTGQSRGLGFTARAMEAFDQRGLLPRFGPGDAPEISPVGHFGGVRFDYTVLPGAHFGARGIPQSRTEAVLEAWAGELGAVIHRGWEFTGLSADDASVSVAVQTPSGPRELRAAYVVGADGGHSAVREAAGIGFPGTPASRVMYLADVVGRSLRPRPLGERLEHGMVMAAPLTDTVDRIIVCPDGAPPREDAAPVTFAEVADAWLRLTGEDISDADTEWVSSFTDATRQAATYRAGRVLVAGDAAHIHLPAGGQGMSTGLLDAFNLGWKLAAEVTGRAHLLDTYHAERHPAGARLLLNTRAQGTVFLGGRESDPLRALFAELIEHDDVKRHLAGAVSGLDVRYDLGDGHPLLGRRVAPRVLTGPAGETTTTRLLHPARGVLLDLADDPGLRAAAAPWHDRVTVTTATPKPADGPDDDLRGLHTLLIRPDGHAAWASDTPDGEGLSAALHRWFGTPSDRKAAPA